jgi:hypothetical protein
MFFLTGTFICDIIVKSPKDLKEKFNGNSIRTSLSNFGKIPYGYKIHGRVYYDPLNKEKDFACRNLTFNMSEDSHEVDEAPIIVVDR